MNRKQLTTPFVVVLACTALVATQTLPSPVGRVNDFASVLADAVEQELNALIETVERETTAQIAVVTVPSLDGLSVTEYALKLFNAWGIGQKGKDNGVLVLVAPTEREMRIEVGYGLEDVLPDRLAEQIIREQFTPALRDGHYEDGILAGTRRVAEVVRRNERLTPEQIQALAQAAGPPVTELPGWGLLPVTGLLVGLGSHLVGLGLGVKVFSFLLGGAVLLATATAVSYVLGSSWAFGAFHRVCARQTRNKDNPTL